MNSITDSEIQRFITGAQNHLVVINKVITKLKSTPPQDSHIFELEALCMETQNSLSQIQHD